MATRINPLLTLLCLLTASPAWSHPAEQALILLLPTELYTAGGTAAVGASILLISVLPGRLLLRAYQGRAIATAAPLGRVQTLTSLVATLALGALIYIGAFGPNDPQANLLPLMIWTGWWIGVFTVQGLLFDVWKWINPWRALYQILLGDSPPLLRLPKGLQAWPAVALFAAFQVFLLADIAPSDPDRLARVVLGYWMFTFAAMIIFGGETWLRRGECFTVLFTLISTLRIAVSSSKLRLGAPGWAALRAAPLDTSRAVFCLMILVSGSFDGLKETFWWLALIGINPLEFPGRSAVVLPSIWGLLAANVGVLAIYCASVWIGIALLRTDLRPKFGHAFCTFAIAILPIALGYHIAHYFVAFLVQSQYLAATLADPFARGWALFGLDQIRVTTGFLNTTETVKPILLTNVTTVVISHIVSVIMTHHMAVQMTDGKRDVIVLQIGLSLLMIAYTLFGLWLLSTPRGA